GDPAARKAGLKEDPKNVPFSEKVNRAKFENEKVARKMIMERGFTWAKNIYWNNTKAPFQMHNPEWTIAAAVDFLEEHKDKPFYLHYCTTLLHGPNGQWRKSLDFPKVTGEGIIERELGVMPPRKTVMERIHKAGLTENEAGYLWMDDSLGVLLDKLDELGIAENTLVLFTADHGSGNKGSLYKDRGTEVPCIMRWPAGMKKGVRCEELLQNTDFVPTWFDLAGIKPPKQYQLDGVSLQSLFKKPGVPVRPYVYAEMGAARSIKTKRFSYLALRYTKEQVAGVRGNQRKYLRELSGLSGGVSSRAILTNDNALTYDQLYDLQKDPQTRNNLAGKKGRSATLESMKSSLSAELRRFPNHPYGEFVPGGNTLPGTGYDDVFNLVRTYLEMEKKKGKK
ncbi:MAG: sulfatase-like hydrolase/transferase, partial [Opitutales bacterium]